MPFIHVIRPRYGEVDRQGVVFNAHWLAYFDDACTKFFEHLGYAAEEVFAEGGPFDFMVVKAALEWRGSAGFNEDVEIEVRPDRLGNASFDFRYRASVRGEVACEGVITYVSVKPGAKVSAPIPDEVRARLQRSIADD